MNRSNIFYYIRYKNSGHLLKITLFLFLLVFTSAIIAQEIQTPLQKCNYTTLTSYDELTAYLHQLDLNSGLITVESAGISAEGRNIYAVKLSSSVFGKDKSKIKVLLFGQQHGNEHSGKEGALLLLQELLKPENKYLFDRIDLLVVPQMNPDGSEKDKRRNGNGADLNRNHLILTEPETNALHHLFDQYLFEVTMDVHEYYPYGETWHKYGYRDNSDELLGVNTNINVSEKIRTLSKQSFLPYIKEYLDKRHITNFIYSPGGPPEIEYIRHSTFDINDGRQSFGIQNTFSFIQEGMNGKEGSADNIKHRAEGQMTGMRGLLEYAFINKKEIKKLVSNEREKLIHCSPLETISIQNEHVRNGEKLALPVHSYFSDTDTIINVIDYRPVVKSLYDVKKPSGYLVPKSLKEVTDWAERQALTTAMYSYKQGDKIEQYEIQAVDSIDFEGDRVINPTVVSKEINSSISAEDYIYVPTSQLKGNLIVIALEPKSMLGLVTYQKFAGLIKTGEKFPILRVVKK
jgi:hypothetical protein